MELTTVDWIRIRAALLIAAEANSFHNTQSATGSEQEQHYLETYTAVKNGMAELYETGLGWGSSTTTTTKGDAI